MEIPNKAETLRQALAMIGPTTSKKLEEFTGFPAAHVGALLARSASAGSIVRGWDGKKRLFGLPGQLQPAPSRVYEKKSAPVFIPATRPKGASGSNLEFHAASKLAAEAEQAGRFDAAANLWRSAADLTISPNNFAWCESRALYCKRWGPSILRDRALQMEAKNA